MKTQDQIVEIMKQTVEVFLVLLCVSLAVNDAIPLVMASEEIGLLVHVMVALK